MAQKTRHPDDITHHLLRSFYVLLGVSVVVVLALMLSQGESFDLQGSPQSTSGTTESEFLKRE